MKRLVRFLRHYKAFSVALVTVIIGLVLELTKNHTAAHWLLGTVAILELIPLLAGMWQDLRTGRYGVDILAATAIVASVILGQYWAAIVVVIMLTGGEALEDFAERRAKSELDALLKHSPKKARVIRKGKVAEVKVSEIHAGDKIIVNAGDLVPVDSVILEGTASFDESSLTGESLPQNKDVGDALLSGSINLDGPVTAKASASAADSQYQQIIKLVRAAAASQAPFVRLADRYSIPFTVLAYAIAIAVWLATGEAIRFLAVIIVATPCPLLLAAPIAVISGMSRASRYGIIVKTGTALERFAGVKTIAFDKTGTLTKGILKVDSVVAFDPHTKAEVLSLAASLEQNSNHVVAGAIVSAAIDQKVKYSRAKHVKEVPGQGLVAQLKGQQIIAGRLSLLQQYEIELPQKLNANKLQQTAVYLAADGRLAGVITFKDEVRDASLATINRLHQLGVNEVIMATGDNLSTAQAVANKLGIDQVYASALPADKLHVVYEKAHRPVAFVGDGINDAPVLTAADVGVALGAKGSAAASESADLVIMTDDISRVASALEITKGTFKIARQSILIGIALSIALMLVFATGRFSPLAGAIVQEVVDVVVIFNALRAHLIRPSAITQD
jgi:heavy metal translocating P-type ATPase